MSTVCIDCGKNKAPAAEIGTWQCDECQTALFDRLRNKAKEMEKDMSLQTVEKLMDEGLKAKDIAEKTDLAVGTVYQYMSKVRSKNEVNGAAKNKPKAKQQKSEDNVVLDKLHKENKQLKKRIEELKEDGSKNMNDQQLEIDELKMRSEGYVEEIRYLNKKIEETNVEHQNSINELVKSRSKAYHQLEEEHTKKVRELKLEIADLKEQVTKANKRASGYLSGYHDALNKIEVLTKKLNHLHSYVFLTDKEVI